MNYSIQYEANPDYKDIQKLTLGIAHNAKIQRGLDPIIPFAFFIRDDQNQIKGGCNGNIGFAWLYVDQLWVEEAIRGHGYGSQLMKAAESLALKNNCVAAAVNTGDWEALDFYKKLGFRVELERSGLTNNSKFYFLRKDYLTGNESNKEEIQYRNDNFFIIESTASDNEFIDNALGNYNAAKVPFTQKNPLINISYHIRDHHQIVGGIKSILYCWGCLFIEVLWIAEQHRGKNLGSYLLNKVETKAKQLGCHLIHLDTFDFQAKDFYLKYGYDIFGILDNCPEGHKRFYLKKSLK